MDLSRAAKRALLSIFAVVALVVGIALGTKTAQAANPIVTNVGYGGGTVTFTTSTGATLTNLSSKPSWITSVTSKAISSYNVQYTIKVAANNNGGTRSFDFVFSGNNGGTYRIRQGGLKNVSVKANKGSTTTYGKGVNETISVNVNWITLYRPTNTTFRIDCAANATGSDRVGYVNVKDGNATVMTYRVTQSASMTAKLDSNGGNFGSYQGQTVKFYNRDFVPGQKYGTLPTPVAPSGTTFDGWYTAKTGGSKITSNSTVNISYETLYARWLVKVRLDCNGGNLGSYQGQEVKISDREFILGENYSNLPTKPVAPTGYDFEAWYTAKNGGNRITSADKVTDVNLTTLYAHWTPQKYTVTFDSQGGSSVPKRTVTYNSSYGTSSNQLPNPSRSGYEFGGWWTAKSGGTRVNYYTTVTIASDHTLYAHWTAEEHTVTFMDGNTKVSTIKVKYDGTYGTLPTRSKTGYKDAEWYTATSGGTMITSSSKVTITADQTLFARWTPNQYEVKYDANGGKDAPADQKKIHGTNLTLTKNIPTRNGYTFLGWAYNSAAKVADFVADKINTYKDNKPVTLYAVWKKTTYTICYYANKGVGGPDPQIKNHDQDITLSTVEPVRDGYTFLGWGTSEDATMVKYKRGATHTYSENASITLYAIWHETLWVTYDVNGGDPDSGPTKRELDLNKSLHKQIAITEPTRKGYKFKGWRTALTSNGDYWYPKNGSGSPCYPNKNVTMYAIWEPECVSLSMSENGKGYDYPISTYVCPGETIRIPLNIPKKYWGYYKVECTDPGVECWIEDEKGIDCYTKVNMNDYSTEERSERTGYYLIQSNVYNHYLVINCTNKGTPVTVHVKSEVYTAPENSSSYIWRSTPLVWENRDIWGQPTIHDSFVDRYYEKRVWEVYLCPEDVANWMSLDCLSQQMHSEEILPKELKDYLLDWFAKDLSSFIVDYADDAGITVATGFMGLSVPKTLLLSTEVSMIIYFNDTLEKYYKTPKQTDDWLTTHCSAVYVDTNNNTAEINAPIPEKKSACLRIQLKNGEIQIGSNQNETGEISLLSGIDIDDLFRIKSKNTLIGYLKKYGETGDGGIKYIDIPFTIYKPENTHGVHFTFTKSREGLLVSDDDEGVNIITDRGYIHEWDGSTPIIRPGVVGEFITDGKDIVTALDAINEEKTKAPSYDFLPADKEDVDHYFPE